jgi:hypothetical protein
MTITRCISAWTLLAGNDQANDFLNPFYVVPLQGTSSSSPSDRSPSVLQFKWHTSSLSIWSSFYLRSLESSESRVLQVPFMLRPICSSSETDVSDTCVLLALCWIGCLGQGASAHTARDPGPAHERPSEVAKPNGDQLGAQFGTREAPQRKCTPAVSFGRPSV